MFPLTNRDYAHFYFEEYDLEAQLIAIRGSLASFSERNAQETAEIEALAQRAKDGGSDHLVGLWTDSLHASVYGDAARSAAAVGMLAPFVENLFTVIFRGIGKFEDDYLGKDRGSKRSDRSRDIFWNPHFSFEKDEVNTDLVEGIMQLADSTRLKPHLPNDTKAILQALFGYRNNMLHNGFEWPVKRREAFARRVESWPEGWFESALSNHQPWVWYMSDKFVARVIEFIDEVLEAAGQHIRLHYEPNE